MSYQGLRASVHTDGNLYVARDRVVDVGEGLELWPEHAVLVDMGDGVERLVWRGHPEGGLMEPLVEGFEAPGDFWWLLSGGRRTRDWRES